ncbi:hypothetical protein [Halodesulfovibrio aestuarii]|uniref:Uncharacterized protein n=1 Tax=Halodesulfovibrio aestuarii TaxID=126333 RepID=A0A8G2FGP7_9BACT|nr:hypothetical protein [Halodesulfovibrio aestuarii]SHI60917.1 hypothetical protein SAMN05660830_00446 [Halodesulfovibrio aestuarii]
MVKKKTENAPQVAVHELAATQKLEAWELAGLVRSEGWTEDKAVTEAEFSAAYARFQNRALGLGGQ